MDDDGDIEVRSISVVIIIIIIILFVIIVIGDLVIDHPRKQSSNVLRRFNVTFVLVSNPSRSRYLPNHRNWDIRSGEPAPLQIKDSAIKQAA